MTITNTENRTSAVGTAATGQEIDFDFPITATSDLKVLKVVTATSAETLLDETTDYTVAINEGSEGGTVTMVAAVGTANETHIIRNTPNTQELDLEAGGDFSAERVEAALDKLTKLSIENADQLNRFLVDEDNLVAGVDFQPYDDTLNTLTGGTLLALGTAMGVSAFAQTILDDATAIAMRATIGSVAVSEMLCHENAVLAWENEILTWQT